MIQRWFQSIKLQIYIYSFLPFLPASAPWRKRVQPRKRPRQPSRCKLNYHREGSRRSCAPWPVASSLKISSLYLSWIIEVISHVSERKPLVAARRGDSVAYVLSRLDCKTRLAETWLLERREKVFLPTSGHVARGYFTKNRRRAEGEQRGRGRGEFFRRGGPIDERQTGLDENPSPAFQPITQANFWFSVYPWSRAVTTGMKVSCGGKGELALRACRAKWKKISWKGGVSSSARLPVRVLFFFFLFFFFVLSACNWNFSARRGGKSGSII